MTSHKQLAIIIKGNPQYLEMEDISPMANRFYAEVERLLERAGYRVEFDTGEEETTPDQSAAVWVAHSRGISRLKWANEGIITIELETLDPMNGESSGHYVLSTEDRAKLTALSKVGAKSIEAFDQSGKDPKHVAGPVKSKRNRKAAEKVMLDVINSICPGNPNVKIYQDLFDPKGPKYLSDAQFHDWMERIRNGTGSLIYVDAPGSTFKLDVEHNTLVLGPKYGIQFHQQLWYKDETGDWFLTPKTYLILPFPVRRQAQLLVEKISIPEHNNSIDDLTGQVTGASRGGKISYPELSLLKAFGMKKSIEEFMHWRGGDVKGHRIMNQQILRTGGASMDALAPYAGEVESTRTFANILLGMHYDNTL